MRPNDERPPLVRLRRRLGGHGDGQKIVLWMAMDGRTEYLALARKSVSEVLQDNGGTLLLTERGMPGEHSFDALFPVSMGHCLPCMQELWERGILAVTISHPAEWDNADGEQLARLGKAR